MCGDNDIIKTGNVYVCQHCGTKYDVEGARKLMVEVTGTMIVEGMTTTGNLMYRAPEFFDKGDMERASKCLTRVLDIDAHNRRARELQHENEATEDSTIPSPVQTRQAFGLKRMRALRTQVACLRRSR